MRTIRLAAGLSVLVISLALPMLRAEKSPLIGAWDGTWDSTQGQNGTFVMTIEEKADGTLGGKMTVSSNGSELYSVPMKTIELKETAFEGSYDSPDGQAEILISGTLSADKLAGKWKVKIPGQDLIEAGNWQATKKAQ